MESCPRVPSCGDRRNYSDVLKGYLFIVQTKPFQGYWHQRGQKNYIRSSCLILKENIVSNWLWFLVPVQSHYVKILESTRNLENTSYKKVGEWSQFGSLNLGLSINNIFLHIRFSIFDLLYCLPKIVLQVKVTIDSLPLTCISGGHKCIWSSRRLIYAHPHTYMFDICTSWLSFGSSW